MRTCEIEEIENGWVLSYRGECDDYTDRKLAFTDWNELRTWLTEFMNEFDG